MTKEAQQRQMDEVNRLIGGAPIDPNTSIAYLEPAPFRFAADTHEIWEKATK